MESDQKKVEPEVIITSDGRKMKVHRYVNGVEVDKDFFNNNVVTSPALNDTLARIRQRIIESELATLKGKKETSTDNSDSRDKV